ncbi:hypothetical protein [Longitalea luteola]|nr:hypothetical protein [Longitalea luteola]
MVRHQHGHDPYVLRKVRKRLTIAIWLVLALIVYLQHDILMRLVQNFF